MPGIKTTYTLRTADYHIQYARDQWAHAYVWIPSGSIDAVVCYGHGGGWIAATNLPDIQFLPDHEILDKTQADAFLTAGIALVWHEYPPGFQSGAQARVPGSSRWPQIPRVMGQLVQYLKTHALDGRITRSTAVTLPTAESAYIWHTNSAAATMAAFIALQPDGYLPYSPVRRQSDQGTWIYTANHRVGSVVCIDFPGDLTRYDGSANALAYTGWVGRLVKESTGSATIGGSSGRFDTVPVDQKRAMSPIGYINAAEENANVAFLISGSTQPTEASHYNSGLSVQYSSGALTGTPVVGELVTASGGSTATLRTHDDAQRYLYLDRVSGTAANFTGTLSFGTSGASVSSLDLSTGSESLATMLSSAQSLAIWDAAGEVPIDDVSEHACAYIPPFRRDRAQFLLEAGATNFDRYYIGNKRVAELDGAGAVAGFPWNALSQTDEILDWLTERGILP